MVEAIADDLVQIQPLLELTVRDAPHEETLRKLAAVEEGLASALVELGMGAHRLVEGGIQIVEAEAFWHALRIHPKAEGWAALTQHPELAVRCETDGRICGTRLVALQPRQ